VKDTVKVGVGSMAGLSALGMVGNMPGMPQNNVVPIAASSMNLVNVGQLTKNVMAITNKKKMMKW
jgi:hypothetical protein